MSVLDKMCSRRGVLKGLLAGGVMVTAPCLHAGTRSPVTLTDIAERQVYFDRPISRLLLGDGTLAYVMALLKPEDPFGDVIGWGDNFRAADLDGYQAYRDRFPDIDNIPSFSGRTVDAIDSEFALSLEPDVVVMNLSSRPAVESSGLMHALAQVGIPMVFVDFRTRIFGNTARSIHLLGDLLGQQARAVEFLHFRQEQISRVTEPLKHLRTKPSVMIERAAGLYDDCCLTYGDGNFGELVTAAGGENLGTRFLHGMFGTLHPEQVIESDPDVVLVTGANWSLYSPLGDWVGLGPGADLAQGQQSLKRLMARPAYRLLSAVKTGRVHAIWHPFYDNPYHFIALQRIAKWLHPELFAALDPEATFAELHERFLPVSYQPGYWLSLDGEIS
ncbi:iron complex transport system substrate-binding protein [Oceanimonas baumannii]|uniref:Iron complex transport system substrate-binding protein n=2 Tax=Oceanimonas baumannii TaxID=129578 RepID=A0ABY2EXX6_9GAMM|nr:iron complex transport system substrate-binding protein [Oceanimonas baumannii]